MSDPEEGRSAEPTGQIPPPASPPPPSASPPPPPPQDWATPPPAQGQYAGGKTESTAIAALVVGIVGLILMPLILGVGALVLANAANKRIQASGGTLGGYNLVKAARIIGIVDIVLGIVVLIVVLGNS